MLSRDPGRKSDQLKADIGMHHLTLLLQLIGHPAGQVDRDGKTKASPRARANQGIDPNHLAITVHQGPAGITGVDGGVGLNQFKPFVSKTKTVDVAMQAADNS